MPCTPRTLILLAAPLLLAGCTGAPATTTAPAVTVPVTSVSPVGTPTPTPSPSAPTPSPTNSPLCIAGEYEGVRVTAGRTSVRLDDDVDATFRDNRWSIDLQTDDDDWVRVRVGARTLQLRIDGRMRGSYQGSGTAIDLTLSATSGAALVRTGGTSRSYGMDRVADVLAPQGEGTVTCSGTRATLKTSSLTWVFEQED